MFFYFPITGEGYQVDVHVGSGSTHDKFLSFFNSNFPAASMFENHGDDIKFKLPKMNPVDNSVVTIGNVFRKIEENKHEFGERFEYSVSETTLEQIFIYFAKQQEEETGQLHGISE